MPIPTLMCHADGSICKTDEAQLIKVFEKKVSKVNQKSLFFDISILDSFFMLHIMKEVPQTFDGISKKFLKMISQFTSPRIDIVFDQYFTPSIKDCERLHCNKTTSTVSIGPNQIRHHNFAGELKNTQFKEALVKFFIDHWANDNMYPFIRNKTIYLSFDKCYSYHVLNNQVIRSIEESLSCEEHEEADTRITYHICQINVDAQVVVCCSDSNILIILLGNMDHLNASLKLWNQWGVGNHERLISISDLYQDLGISLSKSLLYFHAITGCDYTPAFFQKGKLRPFKLLKKSVEYQLACQKIITDDDDELERTFATLEKFICHMYGVPNSSNVNDHLLRVLYVTKLWRNAHLKNPPSLSPLASGWIINDDKYDFVWFAGEQFPASVVDIVIKKPTLLENQNTMQDDDYDYIDNNGSSDDDDHEDVSVFCDTFTE
ncbi:uncharacterized protein TNCV_3343991 [Trichonephila clavipes]|nr:uncharacterized protein TNCV_3343991 [Trichonephila clavipes]